MRCGQLLCRPGSDTRNQACAAVALAALILFPLGISLPVLHLQQLGHAHEASIWAGSISLLAHGQVAIGLVVIVCSIVVPLLKLGGLLLLAGRWRILRMHAEARVYRGIELAGRWGMLDVLLVAVTVAAVKLGDVVRVTPGPGVLAFGTCVLLSLLASTLFNPHGIWEGQGG